MQYGVTPKDIAKLLSHLKRNNVSHFKAGDIEISFYQALQKVTSPRESKPLTEELLKIYEKEQQAIPPDLRADDTMNYDKILHWSGSGDPNDIQMPLTGEEAL